MPIVDTEKDAVKLNTKGAELVETGQNNPEKLIEKGDALFDMEHYDEAAECYHLASELNSASFDSWQWISYGNSLFERAKYAIAIKYYDNATKVEQTNAVAWRNRGLALFKVLNNEEAIESLDKALEIDPKYVDALNDKGLALASLGQHDKAIEQYDQAIALDPNSFYAWRYKGISFHNLAKFDEAIKCYNRAKEIKPNYNDSWTDIGASLLRSGKYCEAFLFFKNAPKAAQVLILNGEALDNLGDHDAAAKQYSEAFTLSDNALKVNPNLTDNWIAKGDSLRKSCDFPGAESCYKKAREVDRTNWIALDRLRLLYSESFDYPKALEISGIELEIAPYSFAVRAKHAEALINVGSYKEARETLSPDIFTQAPDTVYVCIGKFLVFLSHLLEDTSIDNAKEFENFLRFYNKQDADFKIEKSRWIFDGLIRAIIRGNKNFQTKFLAITLIDLLQGRVDRHNLSFLCDVKFGIATEM